jgi:N4-gp56 family major capsid protein
MATAATVTSWFSGTGGHIIPPYYADFMRENLFPNLYFRQLGTLSTIPRGYGDKVKIPRWDSPVINDTSSGFSTLDGAVTAINEAQAEGTTITTKGLSAESITGTVVQFVGGRSYSYKLILITKANFLEGALESLTRELAFRLDRYTRRNVSASGTSRNAGSSASAHTTDGLFGKNVAKIGPFMDAANVPRWDDDAFVAVANPLVQYDMYRDPSAQGFVSTRRYNDAVDIYRGEVGEQFGVRWLLSNAVPLQRGGTAFRGLSAGATGSSAFVFAPDAFYSIELESGGVEVIHHPPGSGGSTGDPANQIGSVSVKVWYGVTSAPSADNRLMIFGHGINLHY